MVEQQATVFRLEQEHLKRTFWEEIEKCHATYEDHIRQQTQAYQQHEQDLVAIRERHFEAEIAKIKVKQFVRFLACFERRHVGAKRYRPRKFQERT